MVLFMKKGDFSARFDFRRVYRPFWMVKSQWLLRSCRFNPIFFVEYLNHYVSWVTCFPAASLMLRPYFPR